MKNMYDILINLHSPKIDFSKVFSEKISFGEFIGLHILSKLKDVQKDGFCMSKIAEKMDVSNQMVSKRINGFEAKGYVKKVNFEADKRNINIELTEKGLKVLEKCENELRIFFAETYTDDDINNLYQAIEILNSLSKKAKNKLININK